MSAAPASPQQNHLLAMLPSEARERLIPHLELVDMPLGMVVYESGDTLRHVYFPTDSIVSLLYVMENGASAEISVVGNDGVIGVALFMGGRAPPTAPLCKVPAVRIACWASASKKNLTAMVKCCI